MLTEFHIRTFETLNSVRMYWQIASNYEWKKTVLAGANVSVGITVSTFTHTVP
jgi:hypothetical protein